MIKSFADRTTEDIYNGSNTKAARRIDKRVWPVVFRKLDILNAAVSLNDLKSPGNQLEKLEDELAGYWSIRVNDQFRLCFDWRDGDAWDVEITDYH